METNMKKIIVMMLSIFLLVSLAACANTESTVESSSQPAAVELQEAAPTTEAITENTAAETSAETSSTAAAAAIAF